MAAVNPAELAEMRHFVDLARRLGLFQAQMAHRPGPQGDAQFRGDLAGRKTRLLAAAFTAGLLEKHGSTA